MTSTIWRIFDEIRDAMASGDPDARSKIDGMLNAAMETVSDVLPVADGSLLSEGSLAAAHALACLQSASKDPINEQSADFIAGRLSAIIDILGFAAARTVNADDVETAMQEPYAGIVRDLATHGPQTNEDLAASQDIHPDAMRDYLRELARMGMSTSLMLGEKVGHILTPAGVLIAEELAKGTTSEDLLAGTLR
jgi:hypothetical protein